MPGNGYAPAPAAPEPVTYAPAAVPAPPDLTSAESKSLLTKLEVSTIHTWVDMFGCTVEGKHADSNSHRGTDALPKPRAYFRPNGGANRWPNALPFVGTDHLALTTAFGESNRGRIDR